ncbi:hypothetical protein T36_0638 [Helicobacter cinaedi]|uniref:nucleotidyl transferase AbiEii/AbiGii toxin family protein n=1 Tax=Helicobacter cinaedi TaxID=213 RepID=UPI001F33C654|nr:nucleotidyl transferase AbiEii/AbiGii toxin family protein [Helicobacter cinaedi]BDB64191.1 hypothetical protein T36_0638 [Helicobacter cinaedi]
MREREEKYIRLYKTQDSIIDLVVKENLRFYLTGGTALQRFYFDSYRYSDDLDFFLMDNGTSNANSKEFQKFIDILDENNIEYTCNVSTPYFKQILLKEDCLKIDLVNDFVRTENGLHLDSVQNIFVNKLETSLSRTEPRDLFDIYTILSNHQIDFDKSFELLRKKTNLESNMIIDNLVNINIHTINSDEIQVKSKRVLEEVVCNFYSVVAKLQNFTLQNEKDESIDSIKIRKRR